MTHRLRTAAFALLLTMALGLPGVAGGQTTGDEISLTPTDWQPPPPPPPWMGLDLAKSGDAAEVAFVYRRSEAHKAGLWVGDQIVELDGTPTSSRDDVVRVLRRHEQGDEVTVVIQRGKKRKTVRIILKKQDNGTITRQHTLDFGAPEFSYTVVPSGQKKASRDLRGKPTVIEFWTTWCKPCRDVHARFDHLQAAYDGRVNFIGLTSEPIEVLQEFAQDHPSEFELAAVDEAVSRAFATTSFPTVYVLDADHRVVDVLVGKPDAVRVDKVIDKLLGSQPRKSAAAKDVGDAAVVREHRNAEPHQ